MILSNSSEIQSYLAGAAVKDVTSRLPLHYAASSSAVLEIVEALLKANPSASVERDCLGRLPLHHAALNSCDAAPEIAKLILNANLKAVSEADDNGQVPIEIIEDTNPQSKLLRSLLVQQ